MGPFGMRLTGSAAVTGPEVLYNGITLGSPWPPRLKYPDEHPVLPPYLADPPATIPIDVGRQLFVDDFLIEETSLARTWHRATYHPANPILRPETPWELRDDVSERTGRPLNPSAMVFSDGVFFDPQDQLFKMWYMGGYSMFTCLATSEDGVHWHRPDLDVVPGTNIVTTAHRDSSTVWLDLDEPDPSRRFKMSMWYDHALDLLTSPNGVHWHAAGRTGPTADRSTFFHNPFRNVWVFSLRADQYEGAISGRYRHYWETPVFGAGEAWGPHGTTAWVKADSRDFALPGAPTPAELYTLDCVAYESLLVGLFSIWRGEPADREKVNEVTVGYSRDGFHWHRPDRRSFLPVSEEPGSWNWANIQTAGGGCLVVGDRLHFYVSGRQGRPGTNEPGVCSTGLATLRRDGFASMDWMPAESRVLRGRPGGRGTLTTRPVVFSGQFLFVNVDARGGELRVEVLDRQGRVISGLTAQACRPITIDGTRVRVRWDAATLDAVAGEPVRFRFVLTQGRLYAFWVSSSPMGHSGGYPAAGGPDFTGPRDVPAPIRNHRPRQGTPTDGPR
jgi:hypothetical protein